MDLIERSALVRRICSGKLYGQVLYQGEEIDVLFSDPSLDILTHSDWIYKKFYKDCEMRGSLTLEESYKILREDGRWDDIQENKIKTIQSDMEMLYKKLDSVKYNKTAQKAIKQTIEDGEKQFRELYFIKNQLAPSTIENLSEVARQNFIILKITKLSNEFTHLIDNARFREILRVYYFEESSISDSQVRQLARSDPWRLYWTASKDTGTPLFPHSTVEITKYQYDLVLWSKLYDYAYENPNRPPNEVIEDDKRFDSWYRQDVERRSQEIEQNSLDKSLEGKGGGEVFIPADKEGAKEVYALNKLDARARINRRQKALSEKGILKEADLPDVKQDITMQTNRQVSQDITNRS